MGTWSDSCGEPEKRRPDSKRARSGKDTSNNGTVGVMASHRGSRVAGLIALLWSCTGVSAAETDRVVRDLCGKNVAMLGESPLHGFGKTLEFKVELVRRLVDECHFNARSSSKAVSTIS